MNTGRNFTDAENDRASVVDGINTGSAAQAPLIAYIFCIGWK